MKKYNYSAVLVSGDDELERMISLLLKTERIEITVAPRADILHPANIVILDLDRQSIPEKRFRGLIGISSNPDDLSEETKNACTTLFSRPFSFESLIENVIDVFENEGRYSIEGQNISNNSAFELYEHERLAVRGGRTVSLTPTETAILALLLSRRGETVSRKEIAELVGGDSSGKSTVFLCTLRKKLEEKLEISPIATVRGVGYTIK